MEKNTTTKPAASPEVALYRKILNLQKTVKALKKDSQSYGYEYLSGDKLFDVVRPAMDELGLLLLPSVKNVSTTPVTYSAWDRNSKAVIQKTENLVDLDVDFTWVDTETGATLTQTWHGSGQNGFDKSYGSALTYAERYFLLKTFHIATNKDDVDAVAATRDQSIEEAAQAVAKEAAELRARAEELKAPVTAPAGPLFPSVPALRENKEFWQWVEAAALGKMSKQGRPAWEAFRDKYRPTKEQMDTFWACVEDRKDVLSQKKEW